MYKVEVKNACSCFLKGGYVESQSFKTKQEAKEEAENMLDIMQSTFCNKHKFSMSERFGHYTIVITPNR
jgi:hypothetical protein